MDNHMTIDKKWNKWLIIGGLMAAVLSYFLFGGVFSVILFASSFAKTWSFGKLFWLAVFFLSMSVFWFGIMNYFKLSLWVKVLVALVLGALSIPCLVVLTFLLIAAGGGLGSLP